jgi:micrococcal nuclease
MITLLAATVVSCLHLSAVDGDTVKCSGQNMRLIGDGVPFKSGIDAPETGSRSRCAKERLLGHQAKLRLEELLRQDVKIEDTGEVDRWKRPLVRVRLPDGSTAEETLIREGYARVWRPDRKADWCE